MAIYLPTPGFKERMFRLCVLTRWDFNFCVRSSPLLWTVFCDPATLMIDSRNLCSEFDIRQQGILRQKFEFLFHLKLFCLMDETCFNVPLIIQGRPSTSILQCIQSYGVSPRDFLSFQRLIRYEYSSQINY